MTSGTAAESREDIPKGFPCPEINCTKEFTTFRGLQRHLDVGRHKLKVQEESLPDHVKPRWADACTAVISKNISVPLTSGTASESVKSMGWASKASQKVVQFTEKVKEYLLEAFYQGENTGHKADPSDVAGHMRKDKWFSRDEWLSTQQIKSHFSRVSVLYRAGRLRKHSIQVDSTEEAAMKADGLEKLNTKGSRLVNTCLGLSS